MIQSMTGFGSAEALNDKYKVSIEIKSVNHRYLDISVRMTRKLNFLEMNIRNEIKKYASRGKVDVSVNLESLNKNNDNICYNEDVASAYLYGISQISEHFNLDNKLDAYQLAAFPNVFTAQEEDLDEDMLWQLISEALDIAGHRFVESRSIEGAKLYQDIKDKLANIDSTVQKITEQAPIVVDEYRKKLTDKVTELLGDTVIDESVLATELVIYSDKICVDEEMVRLRTHIAHLSDILDKSGAIGRELDFLVQEMNREANTTLSKANDIKTSNLGIDLKTEIEKIREQIQNIE